MKPSHGPGRRYLIRISPAIDIVSSPEFREVIFHLRVLHRLAGRVFQQILLRHLGGVVTGLVLGQQMVVGLVLARPPI